MTSFRMDNYLKNVLSLSLKSLFIINCPAILSSSIMHISLVILNNVIHITGLLSLFVIIMGIIFYRSYTFIFNKSILMEIKSLLKKQPNSIKYKFYQNFLGILMLSTALYLLVLL